MNVSAELIDRVVRDVLQALQQRVDVTVAPSMESRSTAGLTPSPATSTTNHAAPAKLDLTSLAVVTEVELSATQRHSAVLFGQRTIVTPSAHDIIRQRQLQVTRQSHDTARQPQTTWAIIAQTALSTPGHGSAVLTGLPTGWSYRLGATLSENISECVRRISRAEISGILLTTSTPHRAVCLANRHRSIRAATLTSVMELPAIHAETAANLYIVDDRQLSRFGLVSFARAISRLPPPARLQNWPE